MATRILSILARHQPFPVGLDAEGRMWFSCNFDGQVAAPGNWVPAIVKLLTDNGLGTGAVDLFVGAGAELPEGDGPYITVIDTGGTGSIISHDMARVLRTSVQLLVTARDYQAGEARAKAACDLLDGLFNTTVAA